MNPKQLAGLICFASVVGLIFLFSYQYYNEQHEDRIFLNSGTEVIADCLGLSVHESKPCFAQVLEKKLDRVIELLEKQN